MGRGGAFSDGKLTLSPDVGGQLGEFLPVQVLEDLIRQVDGIYIDFGAPDKVYGTDEDDIADIQRKGHHGRPAADPIPDPPHGH